MGGGRGGRSGGGGAAEEGKVVGVGGGEGEVRCGKDLWGEEEDEREGEEQSEGDKYGR